MVTALFADFVSSMGVVMNLIVAGVVAGVLGTLIMDLLNHLFARFGVLSKIDVGMIGRMSAGWVRGRFRYGNPDEMESFTNEVIYGYITHYVIGVSLAVTYVFAWTSFVGGPLSPMWALAYGIATTAASWFFVLPSMGQGVCGWRSPEGVRSTFSSLANHLFFGVGMAVAALIV